jgi:hypothetical protein
MAKITPYQQGQLASSVVGTPGVNLGASNLLEGIGHELGQIGAAQHQQYLTDLRQKQAEQRTLQNHMNDMARKTQVINIASGAQVEQQQTMNDLQMKYRNDPGQAIQEYSVMSEKKMQATLQQVTDPETNQMLQEKLMQQHASNLEKLGNWQRERQVPIAEQNLKDSAGSLSVTTGQMSAQSPQDIKNTINQYATNTHDQYEFYHPKGLSGQFEASSDAVKEYLEATAAGGDPVLLEKRIKEFADGKYISPSMLQSVAVQQRGIAAQVRLAQNTEQTKTQNSTYLDTVQQLLAAGNGDMKAINPAVAQTILNKAAPNLTTAHNVAIQEMISRNAVEQRQTEASEKALEEALNASPTGKIEQTPTSTISNILKNKDLSSEDRKKYTNLLTGNAAAIKSLNVDKAVSEAVGQAASGLDKLSASIHEDLLGLGKIHDPQKHAAALAKFELSIQRYQAAYVTLHSSKDSIKDQNVKALVDLHARNADGEFGRIVNILKNEPNAIEAKKQSDSLYNKVIPKTIYADPRQQQYYNYLHKQLFYDRITTLGLSPQTMGQIAADPKRVQALQNMLSKLTTSWMYQRGLTH